MPKHKPQKGDILYSAFYPDKKNAGNLVIEASMVEEVIKHKKPTPMNPAHPDLTDRVWLKIDKGLVPLSQASYTEDDALDRIIDFLEETSAMADKEVEEKRKDLARSIQQTESYKAKCSLRIEAAKDRKKKANTCSQ